MKKSTIQHIKRALYESSNSNLRATFNWAFRALAVDGSVCSNRIMRTSNRLARESSLEIRPRFSSDISCRRTALAFSGFGGGTFGTFECIRWCNVVFGIYMRQ